MDNHQVNRMELMSVCLRSLRVMMLCLLRRDSLQHHIRGCCLGALVDAAVAFLLLAVHIMLPAFTRMCCIPPCLCEASLERECEYGPDCSSVQFSSSDTPVESHNNCTSRTCQVILINHPASIHPAYSQELSPPCPPISLL
jgi:hypothetical protein